MSWRWKLLIGAVAAGLMIAIALWRLAPRPAAMSDSEQAELTEQLDSVVLALEADRRCARSPRGPAKPGSNAAFVRRMLGPDGPLVGCLDHLQVVDLAELWISTSSRRYSNAAPIGASESAAVTSTRMRCGDFPELLAEAVSYAEGCSIGIDVADADDQSGFALIRLMDAGVIHARHLARSGDSLAGARLLLDSLLFAQDFGRGPVSLIEAMVATSAANKVSRQLALIALDSAALTGDQRAEISAELARVIASDSPAAELAPGEELVSGRLLVGYLANERDPSERLIYQVELLALMSLRDARLSLCWGDQGYLACADAWDRYSAESEIEPQLSVAVANASVRKRAADAVVRSASARSKYYRKKAEQVAILAVLESALASTAAACLGPIDEGRLGGPLTVTREGNVVTFSAPWTSPPLELLQFRCPTPPPAE